MKKGLIALTIGAVLLNGCGTPNASNDNVTAQNSSSQQATSTSEQHLQQLFADYFEESLLLNPLMATYIGDNRFNDRLPNFLSEQYRNRSLALDKRYLQRLEQIDRQQLSGQAAVSYDIFKREREMAIEGAQYPDYLIPINQFYNLTSRLAILGSGQSAQPFRSVDDYDDWAQRMQQIPTLLDQAISNMKMGVQQGVVQPRILIEKAIPQIEAHLVDDINQSIFWKPIKALPESFSDADKQRLTAQYQTVIEQQVLPAYQRLRDYLVNDYLAETRDTVGLGAIQTDTVDGQAWYAYNAKNRTTTDLTPEQIHQIGLNEVERIHRQMREVMQEVDFQGDLADFFEFTKDDPQFHYDSREAMLSDYRALRDTVDELTPQLFDIFPKAEYEVRAVESFREKSASSGSYQTAPIDNSRPAIFYLNTYDLSSRPTWAKTALFLHEAAPGHHFQLSIQQELGGLPAFRKFGGETAYIEGWGLYAESLGYDMGLYEQPYQRFGALAAELWRAIRLVVDTGIHAKGWSRQQVLDYMYANAPVAEARAVSEAERFMALPGQALAYKIGQLKIQELRDKAQTALGDDFDIKAFHRQVLEDGALPLAILENKIDRWIAAQQ
ncbi:DUF885 domain-containing protein [Idiomarina xiamenensis]|uniref:Lipoprotein n=1 Tax=Idiomarina xiamenensis 10-D-4 TaxID=740709 RepID=K2KDI6_9GAMM|nr:DUF885 domain-containing protein [Idiomarina xiamenensis]EKE84782.1 hypothetical protein A10D4_04190 [Idiomarina xiamenensis 10-D-4]